MASHRDDAAGDRFPHDPCPPVTAGYWHENPSPMLAACPLVAMSYAWIPAAIVTSASRRRARAAGDPRWNERSRGPPRADRGRAVIIQGLAYAPPWVSDRSFPPLARWRRDGMSWPKAANPISQPARPFSVPDVLLSGDPGLLGPEVRFRLSPLLGRDHRGRCPVRQATAPSWPATAPDNGARRRDRGHAVAEPAGRARFLRRRRPASRDPPQSRHGAGLRAAEGALPCTGSRPATPGSPAPWSTPPSRWATPWASRC